MNFRFLALLCQAYIQRLQTNAQGLLFHQRMLLSSYCRTTLFYDQFTIRISILNNAFSPRRTIRNQIHPKPSRLQVETGITQRRIEYLLVPLAKRATHSCRTYDERSITNKYAILWIIESQQEHG